MRYGLVTTVVDRFGYVSLQTQLRPGLGRGLDWTGLDWPSLFHTIPLTHTSTSITSLYHNDVTIPTVNGIIADKHY